MLDANYAPSVTAPESFREVDDPRMREFLLNDEVSVLLLEAFFGGCEPLYLEAVELMFKRVDELGGMELYQEWMRTLSPEEDVDGERNTWLGMVLALQWLLRRADGWDMTVGMGVQPVEDGVE
ncbi:hypothetical protein [Amycolatopsis sp. NPDC051071]|uniref:hypothetical protein n=1 Tax=Amycolatopsis sp. NPDC051071 TaxID=3154637 RepID=UPI00341CD628